MTVSIPFDPDQDLADSPRTVARLRPKDAATLLIFRGGRSREVLMGRRARGQAFMAYKWVFPGGRIDRSDFAAAAATELDPATAAVLSDQPRRARALALAAVRETFEETGLRLARAGTAAPGAGPWRAFRHDGALPDLAALTYLGRAITPPGRPRRFDARFLMADAEHLLDQTPTAQVAELEEVAWMPPDRARTLDLPAITRFILDEAEARLDDPARPRPFVRFVRGRHVIEAT